MQWFPNYMKQYTSGGSAHQYVFMAWCLVKRRDNFTFTFTGIPEFTERQKVP